MFDNKRIISNWQFLGNGILRFASANIYAHYEHILCQFNPITILINYFLQNFIFL